MHKVLKKLGLIVLVWIAGSALWITWFLWPEPNRLVVESKNQPIPFVWAGSQIGPRFEPHAAILVPVEIPGVAKKLYMQLDSGAQATVVIRTKLESLLAHTPDLPFRAETGAQWLHGPQLKVGAVQVTAEKVRIIDISSAKPIAWDDPDSIESIGTLAADFIGDRVLKLDFPQQTLTLLESVPPDLAAVASFSGMRRFRRWTLLEAQVEGEMKDLVYDSGSSAFAYLIDQRNWQDMRRPGAPVEEGEVRSWNKMVKAFSVPTDAKIAFGKVELPIGTVSYIEGLDRGPAAWLIRLMGAGAMTGNKLFLDHVILLDMANRRFGIVSPERPEAALDPQDPSLTR